MMTMPAPGWVTLLAWIVTGLGVLVAGAILADIYARGYRQPLRAMEAVWPITAIYAFARAAAVMGLYPTGHPARERAVDEAYQELDALAAATVSPTFTSIADKCPYRVVRPLP